MSKIRVFVTDDHAVVRRGVCLSLQNEPYMEIVGEADNGIDAVKGVQSHTTDIAILDVDMPDISGIEAARQISSAAPGVSVILFTVMEDEAHLFEALQAGISGYIVKGSSMDELLGAIRTVHNGDMFIHPSMATKLVGDYLKRLKTSETKDSFERLSEREREVLPELAKGFSNTDIADVLHVSPYTVQTYRQRIMKKLNLHSRTDLLKYALRKGIITLDDP